MPSDLFAGIRGKAKIQIILGSFHGETQIATAVDKFVIFDVFDLNMPCGRIEFVMWSVVNRPSPEASQP